MVDSKALVGDSNEVDDDHEGITIVEDKFELKIKSIKETQNDNQSSHAVPRPAAPTIQAILLSVRTHSVEMLHYHIPNIPALIKSIFHVKA